jgi:catechol 2,3-dioxygenase-like lactoylglutathione lyase family enzyme
MKVDMKFEVAIVPVSDVDRAKAFYTKLGWRVDDDIVNGNDFRAVQLTPPNSAALVTFGKGVTDAKPGSFPWRADRLRHCGGSQTYRGQRYRGDRGVPRLAVLPGGAHQRS